MGRLQIARGRTIGEHVLAETVLFEARSDDELTEITIARISEAAVVTERVVDERVAASVEDAAKTGDLHTPSPSHVVPGSGVPLSGKGSMSMPHAPLFSNTLFMMVSKRPPAIVIPVPTGPRLALPEAGTFGLLLSCT